MSVVDAYTSPNWSIRNSAMMAYSVLLDKCVSLRRVRDEKTPLNTTTFNQFFSRYPPLYLYTPRYHILNSAAQICLILIDFGNILVFAQTYGDIPI